MRNVISLVVIFVAMTVDFVTVLFPGTPKQIAYMVDGLIAIISVVVVMRIIVRKSWKLIPAKYLIILSAFAYSSISGLILNDVSGDIAVAGLRMFFRYVPVFLLPFTFDYDDKDLKRHMLAVCVLMLLQIPVTIYQRFFQYQDVSSGDPIVGMYGSSTTISLISCIGVVFILLAFLTNRISTSRTAILSLLLLIPPSLAETKVTPIALAVGAAVLVWTNRKLIGFRRFVSLGIFASIGLITFTSLYSLLYSNDEVSGYFDLITDPKRNYSYKDVEVPDLILPRRVRRDLVAQYSATQAVSEEKGRLGRIDTIVAPFQAMLPNSPIYLMLGLGIGNVSSDFGKGGAYYDLTFDLNAINTTIGHLIWETGLAGTLTFMAFLIALTFDVRKAAHDTDEAGFLANGMLATTAIVWMCLVYTNLFFTTELMIPYMFFTASALASYWKRQQRKPLPEVAPADWTANGLR